MIYRWEVNKSKEGLEKVEGHVDINVPKAQERMELLKSVNLKVEDGKASFNNDQVDSIIKINKAVHDRVASINLKIEEREITSVDELEYYSIYQLVMNNLSNILFNGIPLGN